MVSQPFFLAVAGFLAALDDAGLGLPALLEALGDAVFGFAGLDALGTAFLAAALAALGAAFWGLAVLDALGEAFFGFAGLVALAVAFLAFTGALGAAFLLFSRPSVEREAGAASSNFSRYCLIFFSAAARSFAESFLSPFLTASSRSSNCFFISATAFWAFSLCSNAVFRDWNPCLADAVIVLRVDPSLSSSMPRRADTPSSSFRISVFLSMMSSR
ncbi:membrane hypothetical protein [uncultured delta proteobacterium]|uniref:Uncharacterized protein n=1 Tax=uncultured delta proteobacterium TaxID=34034 RepID=A0A212JKP9_9DELT|nr:membrane hypothetical protein [uncultured delta proteobacterium]